MQRILVVDDNPDILQVVQLLLESEDYAVLALPVISADARQVTEFLPDLLILDIMLAGTDGREICKVVKSRANLRSIPVLLFSASSIAPEDALACGADDFIAKPFEIDELLSKVRGLLPRQEVLSA